MTDKSKYFKNIKKLFPVNGKREKNFLSDLSNQIEEFNAENEDATYSEYENEFGTPIDIVITYYQTIDSMYLIQRMNLKKTIQLFIVLIVTIILSGTVYYSYTINKAYNEWNHSVPTQYEEKIEESN